MTDIPSPTTTAAASPVAVRPGMSAVAPWSFLPARDRIILPGRSPG